MKAHTRIPALLLATALVLLVHTTTATSIINDQASDSLTPAVPSAAKTTEVEQAGKAFGTKIQATFQKMPLKLTMGTLRVATERQSKLKVPSQISSFLKGVATLAGTAPSAPASRTKPPGSKPSPSGSLGSIALIAGPDKVFEIRHTAATKKLLASVDGTSDRGKDSSDVPSPPSPSPPLLVSSASSPSAPPKAKGGASSRLAFLESRGIIGDDKYYKRKVVTDHSKFPSTAIGVVASGCSGSLITPRVVVTAAHCLYDSDKKKLAKLSDADFTPGEQTKTAKKFAAAYYLVATEYLLGDENYDYAFIVLDKPVTGAGYLGFKENFDGRVANIGYPDIRPRQEHDECHLTDKWFQVRSFHTCDTEGGSSGSAMFDPADYRIAAIHDGFTTDLLGNPINYATEVEGSVYEVFKAFRKAFP